LEKLHIDVESYGSQMLTPDRALSLFKGSAMVVDCTTKLKAKYWRT